MNFSDFYTGHELDAIASIVSDVRRNKTGEVLDRPLLFERLQDCVEQYCYNTLRQKEAPPSKSRYQLGRIAAATKAAMKVKTVKAKKRPKLVWTPSVKWDDRDVLIQTGKARIYHEMVERLKYEHHRKSVTESDLQTIMNDGLAFTRAFERVAASEAGSKVTGQDMTTLDRVANLADSAAQRENEAVKSEKDKARHQGEPALKKFVYALADLWCDFAESPPGVSLHTSTGGPFMRFVLACHEPLHRQEALQLGTDPVSVESAKKWLQAWRKKPTNNF